MLVARPVADLDEAQPVAQRVQAHGFGIDGDGPGTQHAFGQIFFVEIDAHGLALGEAAVPLNDWFSSARPGRRAPAVKRASPGFAALQIFRSQMAFI